MKRVTGFRCGAGLLALALSSVAALAHAQPSDSAGAEVAFEEGQALMKQKRYAEACAKFAESHRLEPGVGILLYLGDCYDQNGETAKAWAAYREALPAAKAAKQPDRVAAAEKKIAAITPRLVRVQFMVPEANRVAGLAVTRDGAAVGAAMWGSAVPVDPGEHVLAASAPGRKTWTKTVTLKEGEGTVTVEVPPLEVESLGPAPREPVPAPLAGNPKPAPGPAPALVPAPVPGPVAPVSGPSATRIAGYAVGGLGLASLTVAGITGGIVLAKRGVIADHCNAGNACDAEGLDAVSAAKDLALVNTVAWIVGGVGLGTGLILVLAGGDASEAEARTALAPLPLPGGAGLGFGGRF